MKNYFKGTIQNPYHISIGAIVKNSEGKICCHYFNKISHKSIGMMEDIVLLMRETLEPNESIESCLARGLMEEFGMEAKLQCYVGSIVSKFEIAGTEVQIEKSTLYFLCDYISNDEALRKSGDIEAGSTLQWLSTDELVFKMKDQLQRYGREDVDESSVIERVKPFL